MKYGWLLILGVCFFVYSNSLNNSFHYDDEHSVENNVNIRSLDNIWAFFQDPGLFSVEADKGMYRPLLLTSYALNFAFNERFLDNGFSTISFHLTNILIHGINAVLIAWLAHLLGASALISLAAGMLFTVHPLAGEPVNYISSRSESLAALFFLASMGLFIQFNKTGSRLSWGLSVGALTLGLLCKEIVVTLPVLLLLFDWLFIAKRNRGAFKHSILTRHSAYCGVLIGYFLIIWFNGFLPRSLGHPPRDLSSQLMTQLKAGGYYLYLQLAPVKLTVEHQFFEQNQWHWQLILPLLLGLSLFAIAIWLYRTYRNLPFFVLGWSTLVMVPVLIMPLNIFVNERRLYLPCAAFCLGVAWIIGRMQADKSRQRNYLLLGFISIWALMSWQRNPVWADDMSLWRDAVQKAPGMPRNHLYLGNAYTKIAATSRQPLLVRQSWDAAKQEYHKVIALNSNRDLALRALNNLGSIAFSLGDFSEAEINYKKAVELDPSYADGLVNLGNINLLNARQSNIAIERQNRQIKAVEYYQKALSIAPNHFQAYSNMALIYYDMGDFEQCGRILQKAQELNPRDPKVLFSLGRLAMRYGEQAASKKEQASTYYFQAQQYFQQALEANPAFENARQALRDLAKRLEQNQ